MTDAEPATTTRERRRACDELLQTIVSWSRPIKTPPAELWIESRQLELLVRAIKTMQGLVLLSDRRLWAQASALARMQLEDAAVAYGWQIIPMSVH